MVESHCVCTQPVCLLDSNPALFPFLHSASNAQGCFANNRFVFTIKDDFCLDVGTEMAIECAFMGISEIPLFFLSEKKK